MVGVPGRSKACVTCKKRRIKCDALRPCCTQCSRSSLECGGYNNPHIFVNSSQGTWPRGSAYTNTAYREPRDRKAGRPAMLRIVHSRSLARTGYEEWYLHLFLEAYLPHGYNLAPEGCLWTSVVRGMCRDDDALTFALLANSLAAVGIRDGEPRVVRESFRMYGRSLGALNRALRTLVKVRNDCSLLSTARLLSTFELFIGSDQEGSIAARSQNWERHVNGDLAFLQAKGPAAFAHGDAHTIFTDGRLHYYMMSAKRRKKLFVSEPAWKAIPWMDKPKSRRDILLDLLLDIPGVLEDYDKMSSCSDDAAREEWRDVLIARCWELDEGLQSWATSATPSISPRNVPTSYLDNPTAASGEELTEVVMKALYLSGCLLLYGTLQLALGPEKAVILPERVDHAIYIHKIALAIRPLLSTQAGMFGQHVAAFPLAMALQFRMVDVEPRDPATGDHAMLLESLKGPGGLGISGFLISMNADSERHPAWMSEIPGSVGIKARARRWMGIGDSPQGWQGWQEEDGRATNSEPEEHPCPVHRLLFNRPQP